MKKALFFNLVAFLFAVPGWSQVRELVPIVRPEPSDDAIRTLQSLSGTLRRDGYHSLADAVASSASGGFGSGLVYVGDDGTNFVITSLHVTAPSTAATLEFQKRDGASTVFRGCRVVASDEDLDLALIVFPEGIRPFRLGLELEPADQVDGTEVWSAGYPALGGSPTWQFGKGNITNAVARIPGLASPELPFVIQHSAPADPGNSGGPLLVADKTSPAGYAVVGMNTWRAVGRQSTNFSVPTRTILEFLRRAVSPEEPSATDPARLDARCSDFSRSVALGTEGIEDLSRLVSYAMAQAEGEDAVREVLSSAPTKVRDRVIHTLAAGSPLEAVRLAIAYRIVSDPSWQGSSSPGAFRIQGQGTVLPEPVSVGFAAAGADMGTRWIREHGYWRLLEYSGFQSGGAGRATRPPAGASGGGRRAPFPDPSPFYILANAGVTLLGGDSVFSFFGMDYVPDTYVSYGFELAFMTSTDGFLDLCARFQYPNTLGRFSWIPFAGLHAGVFLYSFAADYPKYLAPELGIRIGRGSLYVTCSYRYFLTGLAVFGGSALSVSVGYGF